MEMPKTVKTADLSGYLAAKLFEVLNAGSVKFENDSFNPTNWKGVIITDTDPQELLYPEGWYFAKGYFRNKHNTSSGFYEEIPVARSTGAYWR